jgi:hypothetical protein
VRCDGWHKRGTACRCACGPTGRSLGAQLTSSCQNTLLASMSAAVRSRRRETARCCHSAKLSLNALQSHEKQLHVLVRFRFMVLIASSNSDDLHQKYCDASYGTCDGKHLRMERVTENTKSRAPRQRATTMPPATWWKALGELNARRGVCGTVTALGSSKRTT